MLTPIKYKPGRLELIDQRALPHKSQWLTYSELENVAEAIETMVIRGAPAIGCAAAFALALDARNSKQSRWQEYQPTFARSCDRLASTRPTAVNLFFAINHIKKVADQFTDETSIAEVQQTIEEAAIKIYNDDIATCVAIGQHALAIAKEEKLGILTHCNAGALATAGYGTALGVIRALYQAGKVDHVYVDETRPYLQGARLTAYELKAEAIPFTLNVDAAAAYLMATRKIDWVIIGADCIAANGDTANKIGSYALGILAKHHNIAFYVAAPSTTFNLALKSGDEIPVEMRNENEVTKCMEQMIAPEGASALNPSFDVTPNEFITGIITEYEVLRPPYTDSIARMLKG